MKMLKRTLCLLLAAAVMAGALPVSAAGGSRVPVGLNGAGGKWSDFDITKYEATTEYDHIKAGFAWPSSGNVLVLEKATSWTYLINRYDGVTIPAGLVVDFYKYSEVSGYYAMQAHFDTTDGKPYTITRYTTNVGSVGRADDRLTTAVRTFTPGEPSESYSRSFTDVPASEWYYDAVMTEAEGGMMNGYGGGLFGPGDPLTRAQTQIISRRLIGSSYEGFDDNAAATRAFAVILLSSEMLRGDVFQPNMYENSLLLRETDWVPGVLNRVKAFDPEKGDYVIHGLIPGYNFDLVYTDAYRSRFDNWIASVNNKDVKYRYTLEEFPDCAAIRKWIWENVALMRDVLIMPTSNDEDVALSCENYILSAWNTGMISGVDSAGSLDPYSPVTRAEICRMMYNMGWTYFGCIDYNSIYSSNVFQKR